MQNKMPNSTNEQSGGDIRLPVVRPEIPRPARKVTTYEMVEALQKESGARGLFAIAGLVGRITFAGIIVAALSACAGTTYLEDQANICRHKGGVPLQVINGPTNAYAAGCSYPSEGK